MNFMCLLIELKLQNSAAYYVKIINNMINTDLIVNRVENTVNLHLPAGNTIKNFALWNAEILRRKTIKKGDLKAGS